MVFCKDCGASLADGAKFCQECGARIPGSSPAPPAPSEQPPIQLNKGDFTMQDVVKTVNAGDLQRLKAMIAADKELVLKSVDRVSTHARLQLLSRAAAKRDKSALILASSGGHTELVAELIEAGANLDHRCKGVRKHSYIQQ